MTPIRRVWPAPGGAALSDDDLIRAYGRPAALRANFVSSADGAATLDGHSEGLSGAADKRVFGLLRMLCDALVVGAGTLRQEGYRPVRLDERRRAWRAAHGLPPYPTLVVVSARLDLDASSPVFAEAPVRPVVLTGFSASCPADLSEMADVRRYGSSAVDLAAALDGLRADGLSNVLCEGGPTLFGCLVAADLVDELCLTVSPQLAGAGAGRIVAGPPSAVRTLALHHVLAADDVLMLRYTRRVRPPDTPAIL
jgi:riboflavin biosynthesis pyrimidine reductase